MATAYDASAGLSASLTKGVLLLTLNRPEKRNALDADLTADLIERLKLADSDPEVRTVVLSGAGTAFCAGADLTEAAAQIERGDVAALREHADRAVELYGLLPDMTKPVIAAVNGFALAGGCGLAMACDMVVAGETTVFGYPEIRRGMVAAIVMVNLSRIVGRRQALELLLTGRQIGAAEALALGMVNVVVRDEQVLGKAYEYAHAIRACDPLAVGTTKTLFNRVAELDHDSALVAAGDVNVEMRTSRVARRGIVDFLAKDGRE